MPAAVSGTRCRVLLAAAVALLLAAVQPPLAAQDPGSFLDSECMATRRACFDLRIELLAEPEQSLLGYYEPPTIRTRAMAREVYRQLRMDRTAFTCSEIGGETALARGSEVGISFIVTPAEAYRSGLSPNAMPDFLTDNLNLTVLNTAEAAERADDDPGRYLPPRNACWYVWNYLVVKQRWLLSVDEREAEALAAVFSQCYPERFARISCLDAYEEEDAGHRARGLR